MFASDVSLVPLRTALLADARADADATRAEAEIRAGAQLAEARADAANLIARARTDAQRRADHEARRREATQRREARTRVLRARREAYDSLRHATIAAALGMRSEPGYAVLLDRLESEARARLGPLAVIDRDPPDVGGVLARGEGRVIDATLPELVGRALESMGSEIEELWA